MKPAPAEPPSPCRLSARAALAAMERGELSAEALVGDCLQRIETRDALVNAWVHVDAEGALARARELDAERGAGAPMGHLHGIPVAIKDIFDTADMPTECGSALYRDRWPDEDSEAVARLRREGAIILGKTVTAELALTAPGPTANPLDLKRTPGGSSSGSAAAVADFMAPLGLGSQTGGSVIRPASFCGVYGLKPTFGAIPTRGMHIIAHRLDHVGVFARHLDDIALVAAVLMDPPETPPGGMYEPRDDRRHRAPRLGIVTGPVWPSADADARARFETFADTLPEAQPLSLPPEFDQAIACQRRIVAANLATRLGSAFGRTPELLREQTHRRIADGLPLPASAYIEALEVAEAQAALLAALFDDFDALLTLAAPGEAPLGLGSTGSDVMCAIWTLMGTPTLTLPLLSGEHGLPIGVQIIGAHGRDAGVLAVARWLEARGKDPGGGAA